MYEFFSVCVSGATPLPYLWSFAQYFQVFARMSPTGKASVIRSIQARYLHTYIHHKNMLTYIHILHIFMLGMLGE